MWCRRLTLWVPALAALLLAACAGEPPRPEEVIAPEPIEGNEGAYLCPYTTDEVIARWVNRGASAKLGASIGRTIGAYAGQKLLEDTPLLGGLLGSALGETVGREIAISSAGGWDYIKNTSDLSFNTIEEMSVYLYAHYGNNEHFQEAFAMTAEIYPELAEAFWPAVWNAPRRELPPEAATDSEQPSP
jgi:hypothetical protein